MDVNRGGQSGFNEKSWQNMSNMQPGPAEMGMASPKINADLQTEEIRSTGSGPAKFNLGSPSQTNFPPGVSLAAIFRYHMGISHNLGDEDNSLVPQYLAAKKAIDPIATGQNEGRRAVNLGIYNRCIREERTNALKFRLWSVIINAALGFQIIFAAILTALGAGNGPSDAVAAFGTLNTIIAGFLTYLKGTGLPMRMRYFHNQWLKLRAYIEQRERDFASADKAPGSHSIGYKELMEEIDIVEKMYQNIRKDIEKHTPDSFQGKGDSDGDNHGPGEGANNSTLMQKGLHALRTGISMVHKDGNDPNAPKEDIESRIRNAVEDVEKRLAGHLTKIGGQLENKNEGNAETQRKQTTGTETLVEDQLDGAEFGEHDITDVAMERMRENHARSLEAQRQAEMRVKELEAKLASITAVADKKE